METSWIVGSASGCHLLVNLPVVSGRHCRLTRRPDGYLLEDLGSAQGTFVNGVRITGAVVVRRSDLVTLGGSVPLPWPDDAAAAASEAPRTILTVGREPDNDLVIGVPTVSAHHARVLWHGRDGEFVIEDLGSANGTAVGSPDRKAVRSLVRAGDTIYLGTHPLPASTVLARLNPPAPSKLTVGRAPMIVGRDPSCDHVIPDPGVSSRHARLTPQGDGTITVEDLNSSNGTFLNGRRVERVASARPGDTIGLGNRSFLLEGLTSSPTVPIAVDRGPAKTRIVDRPGIEFPIHAPAASPIPPTSPAASPVPPPPPVIVPPTPMPTPVMASPTANPPMAEDWVLGAALIEGPLLSLIFALGSGLGAAKLLQGGAEIPPGLPTLLARLAVVAVATGLGVAVAGRSPSLRAIPAWARGVEVLALGVTLSCLAIWVTATVVAGTAGGIGGLGLLALAGAVGFAIGLAIDAASPSRAVAWGVSGVVVLAVWLLGAEPALLPSLPGWARSLAALTPSRWTLEGLLLLESGRHPFESGTGPIDLAEAYFPASTARMGLTAVVTALLASLIGWGVCAAVLTASRRPQAPQGL